MISNSGAFPKWDTDGVIPPNDPEDPAGSFRSPYVVSFLDFSSTLGGSESRRRLIGGLLDFRADLYAVGVTEGFQWIDGSFVENVEETRGRSPMDIDVVTFWHIPEGQTQGSLFQSHPVLFNSQKAKARYGIDAYFVSLNDTAVEKVVERTAHWYGFWSHTRDGLWKGYLQIGLSAADDVAARDALERIAAGGV